MTVGEKLDAIRKRFVGTGEEHDLLARLASDYQRAYDRGALDREEELHGKRQSDDTALKFAHLLTELTWPGLNFVCHPISPYTITEVADWLKRIGRTPAELRALADAMEGKGEDAKAD